MNVDFITAIKMFFANYANFKGRSTRAEYWWVILFMILVSCVLSMFGIFGTCLNWVFSLACLIPSLAIGTRRLHDTSKSGWWLVIFYVIMIACVVWIVTVLAQNAPGLLSGDVSAAEELAKNAQSIFANLIFPYILLFIFVIWWIVLMCIKSAPDNQYGPNPYGE